MMRKKQIQKPGSALILVIIVTVLLSVVGIMFVMTSRIREMATSNFADDRDLDTAVQSLMEQIDTVLMQDLFGTGTAITKTSNSYNDPWLASLEPTWLNDNGTPADPTDDIYQWNQVTDLYGNNFGVPKVPSVPMDYYDPQLDTDFRDWDGSRPGLKVDVSNVLVKIISESDRVYVIRQNAPNWLAANLWYAGARADADGDGVADSRWMKLPSISTSRGKPAYAAVRIIDNCAMLNLNAAYCYYQKPYGAGDPSPFTKSWYMNSIAYGGNVPYGDDPVTATIERDYTDGGRYLSELNYYSFLRGSDLNSLWGGSAGDGWYNILAARKFDQKPLTSPVVPYTPQEVHKLGIMQIENPGPLFSKFDIGDELEIRNRFIMTSLTESRFERTDVANFSLDAGGGVYAALQIPRDNSGGYPISDWTVRMNASNFDLWRQDGTLKVSTDPDYSDSYKYDRRHVCTFYSFDRNIRSGVHDRLDDAINVRLPTLFPGLSASERQAVEEIFRPLDNQPVDLRAMTDPAKLDPDTGNLVGITNNTPEARRNILHLLYAFREKEYEAWGAIGGGYDPNALVPSARKAAQQVANMIDYLDDDTLTTQGPFYDGTFMAADGSTQLDYQTQRNPNPTFITRAIIRDLIREVCIEYNVNHPTTPIPVIDIDQPTFFAFDFDLAATDVIYGYERQPFISEVYCFYDPDAPLPGAQSFALELINPYNDPLDLEGWNIRIGTQDYPLDNTYANIPPGRLTIYGGSIDPLYAPTLGTIESYTGFGLGTPLIGVGNIIRLQRPDPDRAGQFLTVDTITDAQREYLVTCADTSGCHLDTSRKDTAWGFVNNQAYPGSPSSVTQTTPSLGDVNIGVSSVTQRGYQLPVDNASTPIDRLADFQKITWVDPNGLTGYIATVSDEGEIRFDSQVDNELLHYVCTLSRGERGIPGRININTAPLHVIAAAIPPQLIMSAGDPNTALDLAQDIVNNRPYATINDLLNIDLVEKYGVRAGLNIGDTSIDNDFEERDWIFNRLSNIFTVRSDTFTAYILVRLGTDGPQRRMIAIFDRSNCWTATDRPRLVALHPVPDPR